MSYFFRKTKFLNVQGEDSRIATIKHQKRVSEIQKYITIVQDILACFLRKLIHKMLIIKVLYFYFNVTCLSPRHKFNKSGNDIPYFDSLSPRFPNNLHVSYITTSNKTHFCSQAPKSMSTFLLISKLLMVKHSLINTSNDLPNMFKVS